MNSKKLSAGGFLAQALPAKDETFLCFSSSSCVPDHFE